MKKISFLLLILAAGGASILAPSSVDARGGCQFVPPILEMVIRRGSTELLNERVWDPNATEPTITDVARGGWNQEDVFVTKEITVNKDDVLDIAVNGYAEEVESPAGMSWPYGHSDTWYDGPYDNVHRKTTDPITSDTWIGAIVGSNCTIHDPPPGFWDNYTPPSSAINVTIKVEPDTPNDKGNFRVVSNYPTTWTVFNLRGDAVKTESGSTDYVAAENSISAGDYTIIANAIPGKTLSSYSPGSSFTVNPDETTTITITYTDNTGETHIECENDSCVRKAGGGGNKNGCSSVGQECSGPTVRYRCSGSSCIQDDAGGYTASNCNGACDPVGGYCGDGIVQAGDGEQCDPGLANLGTCAQGKSCSTSCRNNNCPPEEYCATFVSQSFPDCVSPRERFAGSVTMRNCGTKTWTREEPNAFKLGSQNPTNNHIWSIARAYLSRSVATGANFTFNLDMLAPATTGSRQTEWQMLQENIRWFGDNTPPKTINVSDSCPGTHLECENNSCTVKSGVGANGQGCVGKNAGDACNLTSHLTCQNNSCVSVSGAGQDSCLGVGLSCDPGEPQHWGCNNSLCYKANGPGSNHPGCSAVGDSCSGGTNSHWECQNYACHLVNGAGSNFPGCNTEDAACHGESSAVLKVCKDGEDPALSQCNSQTNINLTDEVRFRAWYSSDSDGPWSDISVSRLGRSTNWTASNPAGTSLGEGLYRGEAVGGFNVVANWMNLTNSAQVNVGVTVPPPPICSFDASPNRLVIPPTRNVELKWGCDYASSCTISDDHGWSQNVDPGRNPNPIYRGPKSNTTYTLNCTGPGGNTTKTDFVRIFNFVGGVLREVAPGYFGD